ncbi:uncharacterized protein M421DRAFT_245073 [Didymella exigua CBS 183.55]|uniref:Uncharacterized protein n=1 Tax=Didymella exigua CBS 183.55 TaxID=1150837 RepID=A0A6A5S013_9PLEO|nr:uncharacterized protein M421DRAFT_245073 [Didymella exigua CBS 183.55]KAF1932608.1 hypothetical protein M421DRAFT_245073 [Didymella exigua CBS 183.55]
MSSSTSSSPSTSRFGVELADGALRILRYPFLQRAEFATWGLLHHLLPHHTKIPCSWKSIQRILNRSGLATKYYSNTSKPTHHPPQRHSIHIITPQHLPLPPLRNQHNPHHTTYNPGTPSQKHSTPQNAHTQSSLPLILVRRRSLRAVLSASTPPSATALLRSRTYSAFTCGAR